MAWLAPAALISACRRAALVTGLSAAGILMGAASAQADDSPDSSLLGAVTQSVETVVVDTAETDVAPVETVTETVVAPVETVTETVVPVVEPVTDTVVPTVETVTETVVPVVEPTTDAVVDAAEPAVQAVAELAEPVAALTEPVTKAVAPVAEPITAPVVDTVEKVVDATEPVTTQVSEPLAPVTETVVEVLDPVTDATDDTEVVDEVVTVIEVVEAPASDDVIPPRGDVWPPVEQTSAPAPSPAEVETVASDPDLRGAGTEAPRTTAESFTSVQPLTNPLGFAVTVVPAPLTSSTALPDTSQATSASVEADSITTTSDARAPVPTSAPAHVGPSSSATGGASARSAVDGWADDLFSLRGTGVSVALDRADSSPPRAPYRDIPTSPA